MNLNPNILIFSVFQKTNTHELNVTNHNKILRALKGYGIPVIELQGKYNGADEMSLLISGFEHRAVVEVLCKDFNQECYLESHNDRDTNLVFPDGSRQNIGKLVPVTKEEAEVNGSYSYDPQVGQYFVTKK